VIRNEVVVVDFISITNQLLRFIHQIKEFKVVTNFNKFLNFLFCNPPARYNLKRDFNNPFG
jgi:hypothetical protein